MTSYIQVLGNCPQLIPPQLLVAHNSYRFLINAGENAQRFCLEHRVKLSRITDIVLTQIHPSTVGGLPGLLLTLETEESAISVNGELDTDDSKSSPGLERGWIPFQGLLDRPWCRSFRRHLQHSRNPCNGELKKVRVWGPPPLVDFVCHAVEFAPLRYLDIELHEILPTKEVPPEIVLPPREHQLKYQGGLAFQFWCPGDSGSNIEPPSKRRRLAEGEEQGGNEKLEPIPNTNTLLVVGQFPKQLGKMDPKKLENLQIPKGPWLSKLKSGESIVLSDGREINPSDVCDQAKDGEQFGIWGFFHEESIPSSPCPFRLDSSLCSAIFDTSLPHLLQSSLYSQFLASVSSPDIPVLSCYNPHLPTFAQPFVSSTCLQAVLRSFLPVCFPPGILDIPRCCSSSIHGAAESVTAASDQGIDSVTATPTTAKTASDHDVQICGLLDRFVFSSEKNRGLDKSLRLVSKSPVYLTERLQRLSPLECEVDECRNLFSQIQQNGKTACSSTCVTFLGTGAAMPSKYRNVSGILLRVTVNSKLDTSILLDCGEGSMSQIFRFSSSLQEFESTIKSLTVVFISHRHADHHLGLPSLLEKRYRLFPQLPFPTVVGPSFLRSWLKFYDEQVCPCPHQFISCENDLTIRMNRLENSLNPLINLKLTSVDHIQSKDLKNGKEGTPVGCYGIRVNVRKDGWAKRPSELATCQNADDAEPQTNENKDKLWNITVAARLTNNPLLNDEAKNDEKISDEDSRGENWTSVVYSGDTRPCCNLVKLAKDCDVLIHEGTFEDDCQVEAIRKHHSTISEALDVGLKSNSKYLLITHFSQRYPGIPFFSSTNPMAQRSAVVFDSFNIPIDLLFKTDENGKTYGEILSEGMKLMKPILSALRNE